jgi:UDP-galactopyranose mutase
MRYDVIVVGAGLAGSTAARCLAEKGKKVLVMERLPYVAGHCHDYRDKTGITVHTYGPHIFHTQDESVWAFVRKFSEFRDYRHRVQSFAEGRLFPFPINRDTVNEAFGTRLADSEVAGFLKAEAAKADVPLPPVNYRDAVVSQVGERLYELFFKNYTAKQWGRDPEALSADLAKRIPVRMNGEDGYFSDTHQGLPTQGYTAMVERMLAHDGIELKLDADYLELKDAAEAGLVVYTGELDRFFGFRHGKLEYRSLDLEFKTLDEERFQEAAVVNYPNDVAWTRITEFKTMTGEKSDKTVLCYEYPKSAGEPYYVVPDERNSRIRAAYLGEADALEKSGKFVFVGRLAEYAYYNMDQVIKRSLEKVGGL